jgi:hypothetical protein
MKNEAHEQLRITIDKLSAKLRSMSAVEIMCENLNVKHHISEWETRCLKAEAERDAEFVRGLEWAKKIAEGHRYSWLTVDVIAAEIDKAKADEKLREVKR